MQTEIDRFFRETDQSFLQPGHPALRAALQAHTHRHGRAHEWDAVLASVHPDQRLGDFDADTVTVGAAGQDCEAALKALMPWRKGPWRVGGTFIDTEWRSDWKWRRILPHVAPLRNRCVLDVGCGNGYHLFRMLGAGADLALGADPGILFNYQFALIQKLAKPNRAYLLPLRSEHLPAFNAFDTVFSLGVLYHRRSPLTHLQELLSFLKPGGELILETLITAGDDNTLLMPAGRYAKMANVWFIPSPAMLETMLRRTGFRQVRTLDVTRTSCEEQRATEWMQFQSLRDFIDPDDASRTIEGYPAPTRAILMAQKAR